MRMKSVAPVAFENWPVDDWERELSEEEYLRRTFRVSGECVCEVCGNLYYDHPMETRILGYDDAPFLNRLCDGRLGKL